MKGRNAGVQVAGPEPVAAAAWALVTSLGEDSDLVEGRARSGRWPKGHDAALADVMGSRDSFVRCAQQLSHTGSR